MVLVVVVVGAASVDVCFVCHESPRQLGNICVAVLEPLLFAPAAAQSQREKEKQTCVCLAFGFLYTSLALV